MPSHIPSWTPLQREVIDALGMPIWLRSSIAVDQTPQPAATETTAHATPAPPEPPRSRAPARTVTNAPAAPRAAQATTTGSADLRPSGPAGTAPRFDLSFTHLGTAIVVCDRIGEGVVHLARDIALVVGSRAHAPQPVTLQWPGKLGAAIAEDAGAAQSAAQGLLDKLLSQSKPRVIVVCGVQATRFILAGQDQHQGTLRQDDLTYVWTAKARTSADAKRALWSLLQPLLATWHDE